MIKEADKGGCTVVLDKSHYKQICLDLLENRDWYKPITFEQIDQFMVDLYNLIDEAWDRNVIDKKNQGFHQNSLSKNSDLLHFTENL